MPETEKQGSQWPIVIMLLGLAVILAVCCLGSVYLARNWNTQETLCYPLLKETS